MWSRKPNKTLRFNLHAVAAVLLLTACGDESSSPTAPPTPPTPPTPVATSITLSATNLSFSSLGETSQLTATVKDQTGATMSAAGVTWATSSYSIATVSPSGLVTSVGNGTATIIASSGSASGQTTVTVSQMVASLELSDTSISFSALGDTARAAVTLSDTNGNEIEDVDVDWATSDSTVVTVSTSGLFTAVANGTATITASSGSIDGVVTVSVSQVAAEITLSQNAIEFSVIGDTAQLNASVQDKNGNDISGADVVCLSYENSDLNIIWETYSEEFHTLHGIDISEDGSTIYVSDRLDDHLHVLRSDNGQIIKSIPLPDNSLAGGIKVVHY